MPTFKITDIDEFAQKEVVQPYWPSLPGVKFPGDPVRKCTPEQTLVLLQENPKFRGMVINRLKGMGVWFPSYINHPLVDYIRELMADNEG